MHLVPGHLTSRCQLPKMVGTCKAIILRFYFYNSTGRCERFFYGGCCGNANNFKIISACQSASTGAPIKKVQGEIADKMTKIYEDELILIRFLMTLI